MFIPNLMFIPRLHGAMHWILNNAMDDICIHLKVATSKRVFFFHLGPIFKTMHIITLQSNMKSWRQWFRTFFWDGTKYVVNTFWGLATFIRVKTGDIHFRLYYIVHVILSRFFKKLTLSKFYADLILIFEKIWIKLEKTLYPYFILIFSG